MFVERIRLVACVEVCDIRAGCLRGGRSPADQQAAQPSKLRAALALTYQGNAAYRAQSQCSMGIPFGMPTCVVGELTIEANMDASVKQCFTSP